MGPRGAAAASVNGASVSDATTAVASAEADGLGRSQMNGMSGVRKGGGAASRLADAAVRRGGVVPANMHRHAEHVR